MSEKLTMKTGPWELECIPSDGARLSRLTYDGQHLLTSEPADFLAPEADYGDYELRAVYGYDDCFPSIRPCEHPQHPGVQIADHGELCWLDWQVAEREGRLDCTCKSKAFDGIGFRRTVLLTDDCLTWQLEASNDSGQDFAFIHVIHPLMPPENITSIKLPDFGKAVSEMQGGVTLGATSGVEMAEHLMGQPIGTADFMLLQDVKVGQIELGWEGGFTLAVQFDPDILPTVGIWWNRRGYPDEEGIRRSECAFEPLAGATSSLAEAYAANGYLTAPTGGKTQWELHWRILK